MAVTKVNGNLIGGWAFLIGVVLAVIVGILNIGNGWLSYLLVIAGIIVGLFNIADEETTPFLMSGAVLVIVSAFGMDKLGNVLGDVLGSLLTLFIPATIVVAIKNVFTLARR